MGRGYGAERLAPFSFDVTNSHPPPTLPVAERVVLLKRGIRLAKGRDKVFCIVTPPPTEISTLARSKLPYRNSACTTRGEGVKWGSLINFISNTLQFYK